MRPQVTLAREVETGTVVALKRIPVRSTDGLPDNVAREMKSLQSVQHRNVVKLLDVFAKVRQSRARYDSFRHPAHARLATPLQRTGRDECS